jgi:predicted outer membrane protein
MSSLKYTAAILALAVANVAVAQVTQQTQRDPTATGQNQYNAADRDQPGQRAQSAQRGQVGQPGRLAATGQGSDINTFIASCLLIGNQEEVALAQIATQRAENDQVKQFAQMLVDDHQQTVEKLQPLAKQGIGLNEGAQTASSRPTQGQTAGVATTDQILQLSQQAAQECLQMTKAMMQEKQGAEFDKAFAGMQVGAHIGMLAKLKASKQHASGELASLIDESQQIVESHLERAKELCKELEGGTNLRQARRSN